MTREVHELDIVICDPCPNCSANAWIVDGDGEGRYWLLCLDPRHQGCLETLALPGDMVVVEPAS